MKATTVFFALGVFAAALGTLLPNLSTRSAGVEAVAVGAATAPTRTATLPSAPRRSNPVAFVPNLGQWDHPAAYVARFGGMTVFLEERGWSFSLVEHEPSDDARMQQAAADEPAARGVGVRMTFVGARAAEWTPESRLPGVHHYFVGRDESKWRRDVPLYASVHYGSLYEGIDVRAREHDRHFEYDLLLAAGADLDRVEVVVEGAHGLHVDAGGGIVLATALGPVRMPPPVSWEVGAGDERRAIECRFVVRGPDRFGFFAPGRDPSWAMVVDPGLVWATLLGGASDEECTSLAVAGTGDVIVAGATFSVGFPTTPGVFSGSFLGGAYDAFVTRLASDGASLVFSTFFGGSSGDWVYDVAVDAQGNVTTTGTTGSSNFPVTAGSFSTSINGLADLFVASLAPDGSSVLYATYLGGSGNDGVSAIALDAQGGAVVVGHTRSADFPTTPGAFDTSWTFGNSDGFVTRLSPTGQSLVYSTYLGGADMDEIVDVSVDAQGAVTVVGETVSTNFPTTVGAYDTSYNGGISYGDAFVTRLSPTGSTLQFSTYLGGSGDDGAYSLAVDAQGAITIVGYTKSTNFPVSIGAFDATFNGGGEDAFVTRLSASGATLVWSTFLGGADGERAAAVAVDPQAQATVVGYTRSANFPVTVGAYDTSYNGPNGLDGFVSRLASTGARLVYSSFLGGTANDVPLAVALDDAGAATLAGNTFSANFPTTAGCFDPNLGGPSDAFVARLDLLPTGVSPFGSSSPGCSGALAMSVTSMPQVGNASFSLICGNAAPATVGLVAFAAAGLVGPVSVLGVDIWIDPTQLLVSATAFSNSIGAVEVPLPVPGVAALAGMQLFTQFLWLGPSSPTPCPSTGFSASNALSITIQP